MPASFACSRSTCVGAGSLGDRLVPARIALEILGQSLLTVGTHLRSRRPSAVLDAIRELICSRTQCCGSSTHCALPSRQGAGGRCGGRSPDGNADTTGLPGCCLRQLGPKVILAAEFSRALAGTPLATGESLRARRANRTVTFPDAPGHFPKLFRVFRESMGRPRIGVDTCFVNAFTNCKSTGGEVQHA